MPRPGFELTSHDLWHCNPTSYHSATPPHICICDCLLCVDNSVSAVRSELLKDGFTEVVSEEDFNGKAFMVDDQCSDVFSFPYELISYIEKYPLVTSGALVLQVSITLYWNNPLCSGVTPAVLSSNQVDLLRCST